MLRTGSLLRFFSRLRTHHRCIFESQKSINFSSCQTLNAQLTPQTHPHLLKPEEITPGLIKDVYQRRRVELLKKISKDCHEHSLPHLVLIPSSSVVYMSENIPYRFRQRTDFNYLCGFKEPNCVLLLTTQDGVNESILFVPKPTPVSERWEGVKMSLEKTTEFLCVNQTFYFDELEKYLESFVRKRRKFKFWHDLSASNFSAVHNVVSNFIDACRQFIVVESPRSLVHNCRVIKSSEEIEVMRQTCKIGAESLKEVIQFSKSCNFEVQLEAKMEYECRIRGADRLAFPPVVAGGAQANTIHYIENNQTVKDNEMILMDAGCEYGGFCSDLARTWPINGKYTNPQRKLYDLILCIQENIINQTAKKPSLDHLFRVMCDQLGAGLQALGIISKDISKDNIAQEAYNFCPHHVSHYLGMDVHDTSSISRGQKLLPGMIVTVEPGVYISQENLNVPEQYRGICIRIEDDILITEKGFEVLTAACPKHADEIEKLMS